MRHVAVMCVCAFDFIHILYIFMCALNDIVNWQRLVQCRCVRRRIFYLDIEVTCQIVYIKYYIICYYTEITQSHVCGMLQTDQKKDKQKKWRHLKCAVTSEKKNMCVAIGDASSICLLEHFRIGVLQSLNCCKCRFCKPVIRWQFFFHRTTFSCDRHGFFFSSCWNIVICVHLWWFGLYAFFVHFILVGRYFYHYWMDKIHLMYLINPICRQFVPENPLDHAFFTQILW